MNAVLSLAIAICATTLGQICFKYYALYRRRIMLLSAIALFGAIPLFTFFAVRGLGLGTVYISTGLSYVLVALFGKILLKEKVSAGHALALALIVTGCILYGI
ncbi:SMR family transporter [Oleiagrimonas sp. MCCC 1A03011]|uniref:DMT family transporter n=1 Tax=Oleiagrimonas sp. MCCC 1A03011 TaxID=1926883 RepID=UPI000DC1FEA8|nr:SMR family transporter [Oleiagrimonas sp. MCCC 1A03011]RAP58433.1 hypothetical protein BTJ49_05670 [Oleiagrimonas sp. MCCC 1A03011]